LIRSSKHILKYQTKFKTDSLNKLFDVYNIELKYYINLILNNKLPLKFQLSTKLIPNNIICHSNWKQAIYKHASEIIRSNIKKSQNKRFKRYKKIYHYFAKSKRMCKFLNTKFSNLNLKPIYQTKYFSKIELKNISIELTNGLLYDSKNKINGEFDEFIKINLPWFNPKYKIRNRSFQIKLPIKYHIQSNKFKTWKRRNSIRLLKKDNKYFISFTYEKENSNKKQNGNVIGIDQGYKNLITCSDGKIIGKELFDVYQRISNKKQGSKSFKRLLIHRDNLINHYINSDLNVTKIKEIVIEDLKNVKHKSKFNKKVNNKLQRWSYPKVINKLERLCEENGVLLTKVNPAYTSQTCSVCGYVDKENRNGSLFSCLQCETSLDADVNAAINISHMGTYAPHSSGMI
jgi:IS605 OrfB family transposase